jgi:molecular chaperone DnaK (HSP70)
MRRDDLVVGIDLGTTNTALGFVRIPAEEGAHPQAEVLPLTQVVRPGDVQARASLPSFLYLAQPGELPEGALDLPWAPGRTFVVGEAARERGAEVPMHLVSSAKSWLSHGKVDRRAAILPHGAPAEVSKVSPVLAAVRYLEHVKDAWDAANPDAPLGAQQVFLTVPASFDAVARDLTLEAATQAGLTDVVLLEEPQAAFYAWLGKMGDGWRDVLHPGDRVLVCDVGGGTSDFSLIEVKDDGQGNLTLERVAVGEHILLGGDNMDLALAYVLQQKLAAAGKKIDAGQQRSLVSQARRAKELLLVDATKETAPVTLLGRGSKLIGGQLKTELTRAELERTLVEGFFPQCGRHDRPQEARRTGFMELGLPFVSDAAITRHLAKFLGEHAGGSLPTHVLFNGGVFNSPLLQARLLEVVTSWGQAPKVLQGTDNDLAVARGAAYYGAVRRGGGIRIRGGVARSYYVGIESAAPAIPGVPPPMRALCVVPIGMEEGTDAQVPGGTLGLVVGEPAEFRFLTSTTRKDDAIGEVLDEFTWPEHLSETAPITATLEAEGLAPGTLVPVRLEVKLTEIGTLEIWSVEAEGQRRWRLEYNVREEERS